MSILKDSSIVEDDVEFTEDQHDIWRHGGRGGVQQAEHRERQEGENRSHDRRG